MLFRIGERPRDSTWINHFHFVFALGLTVFGRGLVTAQGALEGLGETNIEMGTELLEVWSICNWWGIA